MAKKKELGVDSMGIQKSMRTRDYLGDGLGQFALNILNTLAGQMTYFYTEKVGLAAAMVATMLLVAKICDAFSDLIMGKIMDAGHSPKGKCRPWFLRMAVPAAVIVIMMFTVPKNVGSGAQIAYVLITNILLTAVVYTAIGIPYFSLLSIRTKSVEERAKMGTFRAALGYIAGMVIAMLLIPITNMLGGDQLAWIKVGVVLGLIAMFSLLVLYKVTKEGNSQDEQAQVAEEEKVTFSEGLKILFHNRYWILMLFLQFFMNICYGISTSGGTYYAKYVLGNDNLVAIISVASLIPTFLGFALTGPLTGKLGVKRTCLMSCILGGAACVIRAIAPYNLVVCLVGSCLSSFALIPLSCLFGPMVNDTVEYNDWKFHKRIVGLTNSANSFGCKVGSGIGGSLIGWLLALGGYKASLAVQPTGVNVSIIAFSIYIPLALFVIMFFLLLKNDLEKKYPQIMADLQERKEAGK